MLDETIVNAVDRAVVALGLSLWGCEWVNSAHNKILRVYIESTKDKVSIEDCVKATKQISAVLNVEDVIKVDYGLEVSSPGVERRLFSIDQYKRYLNNNIKCKLKQKVEGSRVVKGALVEVEENQIKVDSNGDIKTVLISNIEKANLFE